MTRASGAPSVRTPALALAACLCACKNEPPPAAARPRPPAVQQPPGTPRADKVISDAEQDPSWLAGTWKKEGEWRWLLFNLPAEAAELAGNPARVVRKGKLSIHGNYISVVFDTAALDLEANEDHSVLTAKGAGVYRRGAPP